MYNVSVKISFSLCSPGQFSLCLFQHVFLHLFGTDHQAVGILRLFKNIHLLKVMLKIHD